MTLSEIRKRILERRDNVITVRFDHDPNGLPPVPRFPGTGSVRPQERNAPPVDGEPLAEQPDDTTTDTIRRRASNSL